MFGFFKPKLSLDELATMYASITKKILTSSMNPKLDEQIESFVAAGATRETLRLELAAFNAFIALAGMATSLQQRKITELQFDQVTDLFQSRLLDLAREPVLDTLCNQYFDKSLYDFIIERGNLYLAISASAEPSRLVDEFCGFVCRGEAPARLKLLVLTNYYLSAGSVSDVIATSRII